MLGQVYMQKYLAYLLLMAIKIIEEREEPEDQTPPKNKKDRKRAREMKSFSDQLEGEVMKFSLQYQCMYLMNEYHNEYHYIQCSEILQHFDKRTLNLPSDLLKLLVGCRSLSQGLCWLEHVLGTVEPWRASGPQGLRHWRHVIDSASNEGMVFLG